MPGSQDLAFFMSAAYITSIYATLIPDSLPHFLLRHDRLLFLRFADKKI